MSDTAHARSIPWDCSDWQASAAVDDADNARVSVILESLAANRGKTLYCAVDQSDTFTKAETWEAGKDRNERDDTVYQGQNGRFRGFLAAQEGYLTDGESGVTGISRDRVFEFPEEPRRRKKVIKRRILEPSADYLVWSGWGGQSNLENSQAAARTEARNRFGDEPDWPAEVLELGLARCKGSGYQRARNGQISLTHPTTGATWDPWPTTNRQGETHYAITPDGPNYRGRARKSYTYTVTCEKTVIRRRRN